MSDIVLRDIDPVLAQRVREVSQSRGQGLLEALQWLLEQGLHACDRGEAVDLDSTESGALEEAIAALEKVPDDAGFALIGRTLPAVIATPDGPEQSVESGLSLK